jgi:hypothetical protein
MGKIARELSERKNGEFPTQTILNPGGHQQLKAVTTLRNGKIIGTEETAQTSSTGASTFTVSETKKVKDKQLLDTF